MAEETKTEIVEEVKAETPAEQPKEVKAEIASEPKAAELEAELEKTRKALKEANREAADRRKRLDELEAAEKKRAEDAMSETEKLNARLKELEQVAAEKDRLLQEKERQELQRKIAKEVGIPDALANRLMGDDEEAMKADAETILASLPKQEAAKPTAPKLSPTNPANGKVEETHAQRRARLLGKQDNPWTPGGAADRGGGVVVVTE